MQVSIDSYHRSVAKLSYSLTLRISRDCVTLRRPLLQVVAFVGMGGRSGSSSRPLPTVKREIGARPPPARPATGADGISVLRGEEDEDVELFQKRMAQRDAMDIEDQVPSQLFLRPICVVSIISLPHPGRRLILPGFLLSIAAMCP